MKQFFNRFLLLLSQVTAGCVLGCIILFFYASHSQIVRQEIKKSVQQLFKDQFDCHWDGQVTSIDLLKLQIGFSNVSILPCQLEDGWSLYADTFYMSAYWFHFLVHRNFLCHGYFDQVVVCEKQKDNVSYFKQVLAKMFTGDDPSAISFDYMTIKQGQFIVQDSTGDLQGSCIYNCQMSQESDGLHTKLYLLDGSLIYKNVIVFEKIFGNFISIIPDNFDLQEVYAKVDCRLFVPALQEKGSCFLVGDLYRSRGAFVLSNEDQSFMVEPLKIRLKQYSMPCTCSINMTADIVQQLIAQQVFESDLTGNVTLTCMGNALDLAAGVQGSLQVAHLAYKNNSVLDQAHLSFHKEKDAYVAKLFVDKKLLAQGTGTYVDNLFKFDGANVAPLQSLLSRYWNVPVGQGSMTATFDPVLYQAQAQYQLQLHSEKLSQSVAMQGVAHIDQQKFSCSGSLFDAQYYATVNFQPTPHLVELRYFSSDEVFIDLHEQQDSSQGTTGFVGFNCIKNLLPKMYKSSFSQAGKFEMSGNLGHGGYHAQVTAKDAHIRIPSLYNVIQNFTATTTFDLIGRSIILDGMLANLYEGTVRCDHAIAIFDNAAQLSFVHAPLFLDHVLMSWTKGIFGTVSGRLFLSQQLSKLPHLQGNLIVDTAQIKGNIFSKEFQERLGGAVASSEGVDLEGNLDVTIETKEPIAVETSFLQAMVHLDVHIGNTIKQPELEGTIDIASGELKFPYKSLFITHGQIAIMPKNSTEPTFEFVAKGKIKRYNITMRATGTMVDQQIHFESSPYLTEEQIISLLLIGSHENSLTAVMPAMFMQKLQEIIFGPAISKSKLDIMFNRLLQSFKNIRIYPQFSNQTGRGGVRGIIEVDATDRLHGRIDSNLMQLEDTIFEADYLLTDDVTMRAIKDGPSTYGGEVEMRWKFS
jgi:TamB, inner membrane protein subunit of TAM complex